MEDATSTHEVGELVVERVIVMLNAKVVVLADVGPDLPLHPRWIGRHHLEDMDRCIHCPDRGLLALVPLLERVVGC